jgi:hypothetical protein
VARNVHPHSVLEVRKCKKAYKKGHICNDARTMEQRARCFVPRSPQIPAHLMRLGYRRLAIDMQTLLSADTCRSHERCADVSVWRQQTTERHLFAVCRQTVSEISCCWSGGLSDACARSRDRALYTSDLSDSTLETCEKAAMERQVMAPGAPRYLRTTGARRAINPRDRCPERRG